MLPRTLCTTRCRPCFKRIAPTGFPQKEKPHRARSQDLRDRFRCGSPCGWAGNPASGYLDMNIYRSIPGQVRVLFFPHQKRQTTTATLDPPERTYQAVSYKKPLCGNPQGKTSELKLLQTPAPASTLSLRLTLLPPACCSRGQVRKLLRQFRTINSNRTPTCQSQNALFFQLFCETAAQFRVPAWAHPVSL